MSGQDLQRDRAIGTRGKALRNFLVQTIECLKTQGAHDEAHRARCYRLLQLTYIQEQAVDQIVYETHISRRQYFYDLKDSIEILSDLLIRDRYQTSMQIASATEMAEHFSRTLQQH